MLWRQGKWLWDLCAILVLVHSHFVSDLCTYQIQITESIFKFKRQKIGFQRDQEEGAFANGHFSQYTIFFENPVTDESSSGHPKDGEFMIGFAFLTDLTNLFYGYVSM